MQIMPVVTIKVSGEIMEKIKTASSKVNEHSADNLINNFYGQKMKLRERQKSSSTWVDNVKKYFTEYCAASGVHGVRYLGERGRFIVEKLAWTIVVIIMSYFCVSLIMKSYSRWVRAPVIVTFATKETPIHKIPFPAVTICPQTKFNPEIFNFSNVLLRKILDYEVSAEEERYFESTCLVCDDLEGLSVLDDANLTVGANAIRSLAELVPAIDPNNFTRTSWLGRKYELTDLLSGIFTSEGFCYTFNMLNYDEIISGAEKYVGEGLTSNREVERWSLEGGYPDGEKLDTFPRRTFISGIKGGFMLELYVNDSHLDFLCKEAFQGFKVTLHHPSELPNLEQHILVPLDQAVQVAIKPRMITVSEELKSYKPEDRNCYFANEKRLSLFKTYTQQNCLDECLTNFTSTECGCVAFYMPKYKESSICGPGSLKCLDNSKLKYLMSKADLNTEESNGNRLECDCLPSCTSLEYDVEISQNVWNWKDAIRIFGDPTTHEIGHDFKRTHLSKLSVYFKEMQFLSSERHEVYGYVEFFSNTGGLLGLFMGFSVTSAVEILYFLTLRLVCNMQKFGSDFWAGQPDTTNDKNCGKY